MTRAHQSSVGRRRERELLSSAARVDRAALVAIYGRRRVGKTHLVRAHLEPTAGTYFEAIGQHAAPKAVQLDNFKQQLEATFLNHRLPPLNDWREALSLLADGVEAAAIRHPSEPVVVFFDELPWMSTHRSGLLPAIDHLWNARLSKLPNLVWVLCGSAASFMIDRLINAKGGLHNRVTHRIRLEPFRLSEVRELLASRGLRRGTAQTLELYMALGGVAHYLLQVPRGVSASQAIGQLCFDRAGPLSDEFGRLFASLFDDSGEHERLVRAVARKRSGVSRDELISSAGMASGGRLTRRLDELEAAGFLARFVPYGRKRRETSYRLIDEFSLFYLDWMDGAPASSFGARGARYWMSRANTPAYRSWAGYAFEGICLKHTAEIEAALGIDGMANEVGTWRYVTRPGSDVSGAQVDLLFDRPDGIINLCELKYCSEEFVLSKAYAKELVTKVEIFKQRTKTKKDVVVTLITTHGLKPGLWNDEVIDSVVTADALMADCSLRVP
ncbi:archaeal ATPase [Enhygromyxa salina]|uniref:Archaeal ATPase n=1 Tax=Enhygromyxa salina TaxID=215803 RepID=A0A0C1ZCV2_9BACT|nr:ATP-binding protein [Enhygromyxa salina]KIG15534.1 archaeal ATPase [Enhygromyxa salina]